MMSTLVLLAAIAAGMIVVDSQLFPGAVDDKPGVKESEGGVPRTGSTLEGDDPSKKDGRPFQFDKRDNESDAKKPEGDSYFWSRDLGEGGNVSEKAFAPNGSSVIVVRSRDRSLESRNITGATSVYNFLDKDTAIVAIIPWGFFGPCLIRNTTLTYPGAIGMLSTRNSSSFQSTSRFSIDANVPPLSSEDAVTFLVANPVLRRWCRFRPIIITADIGDNPTPYSNSTEVITSFLLETDINIIIPERPETPDTPQSTDGKIGQLKSIDQGTRWGYTRDLLLGQNNRPPKTGA